MRSQFLLALLGALTSDLAQSQRGIEEIQDGLLVIIYSNYNYYSRYTWYDSQHCDMNNGALTTNQVWRLELQDRENPNYPGRPDIGPYFMYNYGNLYGNDGSYRAVFRDGDRNGMACYSGGFYDDQLWNIVPASMGGREFYYLEGWSAGPGCRWAALYDNHGLGYCGNKYSDQEFRLVNVFDTHEFWNDIYNFDNQSDLPIEKTLQYTVSITQSMEKTIAYSRSAEVSISVGIEAGLRRMSMSTEASASIQSSFSTSFDLALSGTWSYTETTVFTHPPKTHVCIRQFATKHKDLTSATQESFTFKATYTEMHQGADCSGASTPVSEEDSARYAKLDSDRRQVNSGLGGGVPDVCEKKCGINVNRIKSAAKIDGGDVADACSCEEYCRLKPAAEAWGFFGLDTRGTRRCRCYRAKQNQKIHVSNADGGNPAVFGFL